MAYLFNNICKGQGNRKGISFKEVAVICLFVSALLVICLLTGCVKQSDKILGRWENDDGLIEFRKDGTYSTGKDSAIITINGASYSCEEGSGAAVGKHPESDELYSVKYDYNLLFNGDSQPLSRFGLKNSVFIFNVSGDVLTLTDMFDFSVTLKKVK